MNIPTAVAALWWIVPVVLLLLGYRLVLRLFGIVLVPQGNIGIVNKRFVLVGSNRVLPEGEIIALNGEAGIQADTLAPGVHYFLYPWQYTIKLQEFLVVSPGFIGVVEAKAGKPLPAGRVLGTIAEYSANAAIKQAEGEAKSKTINAEADASVIRVTGEAEAGKTRAVGSAEADVIQLKIKSMEAGNYAAIETAKALASGTKPIVPQIMAGGEGSGGGTLVDVLLAQLIASNGTNAGKKA